MPDSILTSSELTAQNAPALGARVIYEVPRTADLQNLLISLGSSVTLSTGATALVTDGILNLITSVELLANSGRDVICSVPFAMLCKGNFARAKRGINPVIVQPGVTIATHPFSAQATLDLSAFGALRPKETALRENNYESLQLALRFAPDFTGVFTGGGFVVAGSTLTLTIMAREIVELPDAQGKYSSPLMRLLQTSSDVIISGASNKVQHKLTPNQGLRGVVLKVQSNATPPVLSDTLLTRTRVNVGKVQRLDLAAATIKEYQKHNYPTAPGTGYFYLDFADCLGAGDRLADLLDLSAATTNGADSILEFDVSGACTISVMQQGYIPLAQS